MLTWFGGFAIMKFPHVLRGQFHSRLLSAKTDGQGVFDTAYLESGYQKSKLPGGSSNDYDGAGVQNVQDCKKKRGLFRSLQGALSQGV